VPSAPPPAEAPPEDSTPPPEASAPPETSLEIELPNTQNGADVVQRSVLVITKQGDLVFEGKVLKDMASLEAAARRIAADRTDPSVVIMADSGTRYGRIIEAIDAMKRGGIINFAFAVEASGAPAPAPPP
jgi:biopolymer transport protein ExbD